MTPTERIVAASAATFTVTDAAGRELTIRRPDALDKLRLFKAMGPALSQNAGYLGMAILAASVSAIDGIPVPPPATEQQIENLVSRLGNTGLAAIGQALNPAVPPAENAAGN